jgi:hypothetical protein
MIVGYYYLHENGDLIYKSGTESIIDIRESPFAIGAWPMDIEDRETAWNICVEGLAGGARSERVAELAAKWGCDDEDATRYAEYVGCVFGEDGDQKIAMRYDFTDMQESPCGFGDTYLEAMADLAKQLDYTPSKIWGRKFRDLMK